MAEWWQQPYADRQAAGLVQTPGLVDWGGIYDALQAPYWQRQDREQGAAVADPISLYSKSNYVASPRSAIRPSAAMEDPITLYARSNYTASPRFASKPVAPSAPNQPGNGIVSGKSTAQLSPGAWDNGLGVAFAPTLPQSAAVTAIDGAAPNMPYGLPTLKGTNPAAAYAKGYVASPRFTGLGSSPIHQLNVDVAADEGQYYADSMGMPVRTKSGTVYQPKGGAQTPKERTIGSLRPAGTPPSLPGGQRQGGGLLSLFGGGKGGGILSALLGGVQNDMAGRNAAGFVPGVGAVAAPNPGYVTTPFQEDRFQTTTGAVMPSSMNNSRWTTGY